ncbi:MAG TPA: 2-phospho-L-lactate transferase [Micromonosporaceae bacterium]|jgi:LPPG:FO 2-phospho-L-lactate transferase|nr:2-phospho-L-lactate transferase [Micromonosporaceae bacterium]
MHIVVLAGGIGGARFLTGVRAVAEQRTAAGDPTTVTAIVNVGDDVTMHGLRICPDLDSVMYTLADAADTERGWGREGETWVIKAELAAYGAEPTWFGLGDKDVATHLVRTRLLAAGHPLSTVTATLCERWHTGITLLPASDDRLETHVVVGGATAPSGTAPGADGETEPERAIHFQEWWVRHRAGLAARRFVFVGAESAKPAAGVLDAVSTADIILIAPSNPVVSIAPILAVGGLRDALVGAPAKIVGYSPIIGGSPVRGMADKCLAAISVEVSAEGVGGLYGARSEAGLLDAWLVDDSDAGTSVPGVAVHVGPLWMTDVDTTADMVRRGLDAVSA